MVQVPVCIKPATDWRAPYNQGPQSGNCPSGYQLTWVVSGDGGGYPLTVCIKGGLDWRAPDNQGCPVGFEAVGIETAPPWSGIPVCVKLDTDWRAPYNSGAQNGQCPATFTMYWIAQSGGVT